MVTCAGTLKIWHANTYRLETTLNYGMERVWCCYAMKVLDSYFYVYVAY